MTTAALALVLASACMHATWNYLVKRSSDKSLFFWAMAAVGFTGLAVPGVAFAVFDGFTSTMLGFALISVCFHASYAVTLTRSYRLGDLSSVYPISRGMGPALVPLLAVLLLGESVSAMAVAGIALVVAGIYATHIDSRLLRDFSHPLRALAAPGTRIAFLTGVIIAAYTISDKAALNHDSTRSGSAPSTRSETCWACCRRWRQPGSSRCGTSGAATDAASQPPAFWRPLAICSSLSP